MLFKNKKYLNIFMLAWSLFTSLILITKSYNNYNWKNNRQKSIEAHLELRRNSPEVYEANPHYSERTSLFENSDKYNCGDTDILFVGDSLIERGMWNELFPQYKTLNRGIGSDTTLGVIRRLDGYSKYKPSMVILLTGINDLQIGIPVKEIVSNYKQIINIIMGFKSKCIYY